MSLEYGVGSRAHWKQACGSQWDPGPYRALGKICPRSAVGRPNGTRLRLRLLRVLWTNGRLPKELPKHGSPRRTYIYVGGVLSPHGAATDNGCPLIRGPPGGGLGSH